MKSQRLLIALTAVNFVLLAFSLGQAGAAGDPGVAPVLRGRALEIVDDSGRIRASIAILPADPGVKMPDGRDGYPETVLLRLVNSKGRPNVKIVATERGAGQVLGGESDPTYVPRSVTMSVEWQGDHKLPGDEKASFDRELERVGLKPGASHFVSIASIQWRVSHPIDLNISSRGRRYSTQSCKVVFDQSLRR